MSALQTLLSKVPLKAGVSLPPAIAESVDFVLKLITLTSTGDIHWEKTAEDDLLFMRRSDYEARVGDDRLILSLAQGLTADVPARSSAASLRVVHENGETDTVPYNAALSGLAVAVQTEMNRSQRAAEAR